jgi:hypothetical protein
MPARVTYEKLPPRAVHLSCMHRSLLSTEPHATLGYTVTIEPARARQRSQGDSQSRAGAGLVKPVVVPSYSLTFLRPEARVAPPDSIPSRPFVSTDEVLDIVLISYSPFHP